MERHGQDSRDDRIETGRLVLRRPMTADAPAIAALANNWRVAANLARMPHPYREADALDWIAATRSARATYLVTRACDEAPVGACAMQCAGWTSGIELAYWLGEPYWGRGYATEAARALIGRTFARTPQHHIWCSCRVTNDASRAVMHRCGFQFHSAGMMFSLAPGANVAVEHYCLDRAVWEAFDRWKAA